MFTSLILLLSCSSNFPSPTIVINAALKIFNNCLSATTFTDKKKIGVAGKKLASFAHETGFKSDQLAMQEY